jgi:choline dehydrogenase-like flavoprotein
VQVDKIIFDGRRASSVSCQRKGKAVSYHAKREIILCAGTLESPQILQRSGIGPAALLQELAIPVIYDNAAVGANLREHLLLGISFEVKSWEDTENRQYAGLALIWNVLRYLFTRKGPMAESPCHAAAFICSNESLDAPDIQLMFNPYSREGNQFSKSPGVSIAGYPTYPTSTGELLIRSQDPSVAPLIKPNYLSEKYDQQASVAAIRYIRKLAAQQPLAAMLVQEMPATAAAQTDDEIIDLYRRNGMPGFHATGTCAMGADSNTSVVDGHNRVHGVDGLRVVDCSIYPQMLSGVTNASIMAVAMRAADLLLEEHKLP